MKLSGRGKHRTLLDMSGTSDPLFSFEYWLVNHKATLRTWWAVSLMAIMLLGTIWVVGFMALFLTQEHQVNLRFQQTLSRLQGWTPTTLGVPQPLTVGSVVVLPAENSRYDILATVTNPNAEWGATELQLTCTIGTATVVFPKTFINPGEARPIVFSSQSVTPSAAECLVSSQMWHRTVAAAIAEPKFTVQKKEVVSTTAVIGGKTVPVVRVDATVQNDSGNNFQVVEVALVVRAGEEVIAADILPLNKWATRSIKTMTNTWTLERSGITSVDIVPLVSRFDRDIIY